MTANAAPSPTLNGRPDPDAAVQDPGRAPADPRLRRGDAVEGPSRPGPTDRSGPFTTAPPSAVGGPGQRLTRGEILAARRGALVVDLGAVGASMAANVAAAPQSLGGWLVAVLAPVGLFASVFLWHRSRGLVVGAASWLFSTLLGLVALGAAVVSFDHIREVAERYGQGSEAAIILPLVVDLTAVLATIVVVSAGHRLAELDAATVEAERVERLEVEQLAAERAERERLAEVHAREAEAAAERARLDAEAEAARARSAEAERAEREAAEAAARRVRLEARSAANGSGTNGNGAAMPSADRGGPSAPARRGDTAQAIADYLAEHPDATRARVAEGVGCDPSTVKRSPAWKEHRAARQTETNETTPRPLEVAQ